MIERITASIDRRRFLSGALRWAAAAPGLLSLTACGELIEGLAESCPDDPSESGGVDWPPDIVRPVFYGYEDLTETDGAPVPLRIWYPTYEGFLPGPPLLKLCVTRWPLVLFLHGQLTASTGSECHDPVYNTRWESLPRTLAKSGYVVLVPLWDAGLVQDEDAAIVGQSLALLDWARNDWVNAEWVDQRPEAVATAGHSYGAVAAAFVARARSPISAYVGFGGVWTELSDPRSLLTGLGAPAFFMWVAGEGSEDLDNGGLWEAVPGPKAAGEYDGEHFDYIRDNPVCDELRGPCPHIERASGDLAALFIARYMRNPTALARVSVTLEPPPAELTPRQEFFRGTGHLSGLTAIRDDPSCHVELRWEDGNEIGSRQVGS